jgi:hypothetical protein
MSRFPVACVMALLTVGCSSMGRSTIDGSSDTPNDTPANDAPANDAPANDAPANDAPANDAPANDAPANDAPANDAPAGDAADAAPRDAANDPPTGDAADAAVCQTIDAFCAAEAGTAPIPGARCVRDWATAKTPAAWCPNGFNIAVFAGCNGYDVIVESGIDTSYFYVYDDASGALIAVSYNANGRSVCVAGDPLPANLSCNDGGGFRGPSICAADASAG